MDAPSCTTLPNHEKQIPTLSSQKNKSKMKDLKIQIIGRDSSFLKSQEFLVPLTKLSPFSIEKCIKSCAVELKIY